MKSLLYLTLILLTFSSCRYGRFLETEEYGNVEDLFAQNKSQHVLDLDDKITVSVWDHNNVSLGSIFSIYSANETFGKWVLIDSMGNAILPKLGTVNLGGLNCQEAAEVVRLKLEIELVDPIVVVKVLNKEVTVLGEVKNKGNYLIDKEQTTFYELLGKAGGLLQYANTEKIQLIRNNTSYSLDLSVKDVRGAHALIVKAGDIIYVPAKAGKNFDLSIQRIIPFASAITAVAVFSTLLK